MSKMTTKTMATLLIAVFIVSISMASVSTAYAQPSEIVGYRLVAIGAPAGNEDRIVIAMPDGFPLGMLNSISWEEWLVAGYPPHVDVCIDADGDGDLDDKLVFEYAYNGHIGDSQPTYGALTGAWYATFNDDELGPEAITDAAKAWPTTGPAGGPDIQLFTLAEWKAGITPTVSGVEINADSIVLMLEIEVDSWMVNTEAYVKNIQVNGVSTDLLLEVLPRIVSIMVSPASIDFGKLKSGATESKDITVYNIGDIAVTVDYTLDAEPEFLAILVLDPTELDGLGLIGPGEQGVVTVSLTIPVDMPVGIYTGQIVFEATPEPPTTYV